MDKDKAIELLKQALSEIAHLRTLNLGNQEFELWCNKVTDIIEVVFGKSSSEYERFVRALTVLRFANTDAERQEEYDRRLDAYETALKSIIQKYDVLGVEIEPTSKPELPKVSITKANWKDIENEFGITKKAFGTAINFVSDRFRRDIIFRDVEHAFCLASAGYSKPAVILAGGVIEELLRLYLKNKNIKPEKDNFNGYIKACEQHDLLKSAISRLSDSVRQFRNLVHLSAEKTRTYTISKATAKGAVSSIFTISNDF